MLLRTVGTVLLRTVGTVLLRSEGFHWERVPSGERLRSGLREITTQQKERPRAGQKPSILRLPAGGRS